MALEEKVKKIREAAKVAGREPVPGALQRVTKARVRHVLKAIARESPDTVDAVFALLDDQQPSWFTSAPDRTRFSDGASTAHIACHVGILQRGERKLDREGRDYWIKPLREVGAVRAVTLDADAGTFIDGHPIAKSSHSAYRLDDEFKALLQAREGDDADAVIKAWIDEDAVRRRLELQARLAAEARAKSDTKHADLIAAVRNVYALKFLPGFKVLYVDDGDGTRIPDEARQGFAEAGLNLQLGDAMPDVLLHNPTTDAFWIIEAVTSDGEVDFQKVQLVTAFIRRTRPKAEIGFTTAYRTWKEAAGRQGKQKNLAPDTYLWIREDPSRHLRVECCE